jgi:ABC-2 type transport system ATP-binding protein
MSSVFEEPLQIRGLSKRYGAKPVLEALDLTVQRGRVLGLLGRNGAGKSTLIECALGLRGFDAGQIKLLGHDPLALPDDARAQIGYVPQSAEVFEWLTVKQMLAYFRAFYPRWNDGKVASLMVRWEIAPEQSIAKLSGGQKQRLSIIRALAHDPELLILDEPVAALDPAARRDFLRELVERVVGSGTTILFSTHILTDLERVAVDVALLRDGRLALQQPLDTLIEQARRVVGPAAVLRTLRLARCLSLKEDAGGGAQLIAQLDHAETHRLDAMRSQGIRVETVGLEDLFVEVTQ